VGYLLLVSVNNRVSARNECRLSLLINEPGLSADILHGDERAPLGSCRNRNVCGTRPDRLGSPALRTLDCSLWNGAFKHAATHRDPVWSYSKRYRANQQRRSRFFCEGFTQEKRLTKASICAAACATWLRRFTTGTTANSEDPE